MKKIAIVLAVLAFIAVIFLWFFVGSYNRMVGLDEGVTSQWAQVENQYQRRGDLIPNLVEVVKGYASHEKETLEGIVEARAKATSITIDPSNLTEESLAAFQKAQEGVSSSLARLMAVVENYPDLKANQNFMQLQAQLEGTENRIAVERMKFNEIAQDYNVYIRKFPQMIFANMYGFEKKAYFKSKSGTEEPPQVKF